MFCFQIHACAYCTMNEKFSILHEAKLSAVLKISSSFSNPFNIQFEFTAGDRLTMASRPKTAQFLCVVITRSVTLMLPGNENSCDQF